MYIVCNYKLSVSVITPSAMTRTGIIYVLPFFYNFLVFLPVAVLYISVTDGQHSGDIFI